MGAAPFDEFIAGLRYGCVAINVPSLVPFCLPALVWGAYPGQ